MILICNKRSKVFICFHRYNFKMKYISCTYFFYFYFYLRVFYTSVLSSIYYVNWFFFVENYNCPEHSLGKFEDGNETNVIIMTKTEKEKEHWPFHSNAVINIDILSIKLGQHRHLSSVLILSKIIVSISFIM